MGEIKSRNDLSHMIAEKAGFTVNDVEIILNTFADCVVETLVNGDGFQFRGLFDVKLVDLRERRMYDGVHKTWINVPATKRVVFSAGEVLKDFFRTKKRTHYITKWEEKFRDNIKE